MSGRRSHVRFAVVQPPEGVFRVMRDVLLQRASDHELIAISREPGLLGEAVVVEFPADHVTDRMRARVVESQPVVVGGSVRHRLKLEAINATSRDSNAAQLLQRGPAQQ